MARRKGRKEWNEISREEWLALFADTEIMTDLVMKIFAALYRSARHEANAKSIASAMGIEYRALNAAVGWAGTKIRDWYAEKTAPAEKKEAEEAEGELLTEEQPEETALRAPWEYVFDGTEDEAGAYFWILKPAAAEAWREMEEADWPERDALRRALAEDASSFGREGSLFAAPPQRTVERVREVMEEEDRFRRRGFEKGARCTVCGAERTSLLRAFPYGDSGRKQRGLLFCPTHGALFAAHLITFDAKGRLLISDSLSDTDRKAFGIEEGMEAKNPFSGRRMAPHRRIFNILGRKKK